MWDETEFKVCPTGARVATDLSIMAMHGHVSWKQSGEGPAIAIHEEEVCMLPACLSEKTA